MTPTACPVCDGEPRVLVAIRHPPMRRLTRELLARDHRCWRASAIGRGERLDRALAHWRPDLLVVDAADFPACCRPALNRFPAHRVVVVGAQQDEWYRAAALRAGAGGWVSRERVAEELGAAMRAALGCHHDPCPATDGRRDDRHGNGHVASTRIEPAVAAVPGRQPNAWRATAPSVLHGRPSGLDSGPRPAS
jgi:DNA-binding NarL/FixJ family response regulator